MRKLFFRTALTAEGWQDSVAISVDRNGDISDLEYGVSPPSAWDGDIALPGLPNLHSHGFQRGMAGLAEYAMPGQNSFWSWRETMYRFVQNLEPEQLSAITALAYAEMLESGFTSVAEFHYLHNQKDGTSYKDPGEMACGAIAAAESAGIGLTLLPVFYAHSDFGGAEPNPDQRRFVNSIDNFQALVASCQHAMRDSDGVVGIAPHSLRAVSIKDLEHVSSLAEGPVHIHIAEQAKEVERCLQWSGMRSIDLLFNSAEINSRWCLVHATHASNAEYAKIARSGAVVGLCPVTEANLGDGLFDLRGFLGLGGRIGVGSDSNILISATEELRWLEYGQRLKHQARNIISDEIRSSGANLFHHARLGGAQACGRPIGSLEPEMRADIIVLKSEAVSLAHRKGDSLLDTWIFACPGREVDSVWVGGVQVVCDGKHVRRAEIEKKFRTAMDRLLTD